MAISGCTDTIRVQELRDDLRPIHEPRTGSNEVTVRVHGPHLGAFRQPAGRDEVGGEAHGCVEVISARRDDHDIGGRALHVLPVDAL